MNVVTRHHDGLSCWLDVPHASSSASRAPVKAGEVKMVKVQTTKGIATHVDSESCAAAREGRGEALTGEVAGRVFSREIDALGLTTRGPLERRRRVGLRKATLGASSWRDVSGLHAVRDPEHAMNHLARKPGDLTSACDAKVAGRIGKL